MKRYQTEPQLLNYTELIQHSKAELLKAQKYNDPNTQRVQASQLKPSTTNSI